MNWAFGSLALDQLSSLNYSPKLSAFYESYVSKIFNFIKTIAFTRNPHSFFLKLLLCSFEY